MKNPSKTDNPIKDTFKRTVQYKFEDADEQMEFDTKGDMLEALIN